MKQQAVCKVCRDTFVYDDSQKIGSFCSMECFRLHKKQGAFSDWFLLFVDGLLHSRTRVNKVLTRIFGHQCWICLNKVWNGEPIPLRVDHIDGNAGNARPSNYRLICPNCDSQLPTFAGRNRGYGRKARGLKMK